MLEKDFSNHVLGLETDGQFLQGCVLTLVQKKPEIDRIFSIPIEEKEDSVKLLYNDQEEEDLLKSLIEKSLVIASLSSKDVLVRPLYIKLLKEKQIENSLLFQAEPLIPYPIEEGVLDYSLLKKDKEGSFLSIFSAKKEKIDSTLKYFEKLDLEPEVLSAPSFALKLFTDFFVQEEEPYFLVHFTENTVLVLAVFEKEIKSSQTLSYAAPLNSLSKDHPFFKDLSRIFSAIEKQTSLHYQKVLITGKESSSQSFSTDLFLFSKTEIFADTTRAPSLSQKKLSKYALSIGLGLSGLNLEDQQINFRQKEFAYKDIWKHLKKPLIIYFVSVLLLSFSFFLFGKAYLNYQETKISQSYSDLLFNLNISPSQTEQEFAILKKLPPPEEKALYNFSLNDLSERLVFVESKVKKNESAFPLQPNVPRVWDILAFLAKTAEEASKKGSTDSIKLENFNYKYVKKPEKTKPKDHYQVFVDIEFSTDNPSVARQFHDLLLTPNDFIDPKSEIKWTTPKGLYKASFFVKDKTNYTG